MIEVIVVYTSITNESYYRQDLINEYHENEKLFAMSFRAHMCMHNRFKINMKNILDMQCG